MLAYIAWDGDHIGRIVGQKSLQDDVEGLRRVSQNIDRGNMVWKSWVELAGGSLVSMGGDEGRAEVPADKLADLPKIREQYAGAVESSVSVGVGMKLSEAERALVAAKLHGGDKVVFYSPQVDADIEKAKQDKDQDGEAAKIVDSYLGKAECDELEKAIADIKPGMEMRAPDPDMRAFDYSHVLPPEHQRAGYKLHVLHLPKDSPDQGHTTFDAVLHHNGQEVGSTRATAQPNGSLEIGVDSPTWIEPEHRGKSLGVHMYEAALAHGKHQLGSQTLMGGSHSTAASVTHQKLARIHGLDYKPQYNRDIPGSHHRAPEDHDSRYGAYQYAIKDELPAVRKAQPAMNAGAGGGFGGAHPAQGAARPTPPKAEASEHSEAEALYDLINEERPGAAEGTHAAQDLETDFHQLAQQQAGQDDSDRQVNTQRMDQVKSQVVTALQQVRSQGQILDQLRQSAPDTYKAIMGVVQAMIALAREVSGDDNATQKSEDDDFEPLMKTDMKKPPKGFGDEHKHVLHHLLHTDPHGGTMRDAIRYGWRQINPDDYYWPKKPVPFDPSDDSIDVQDPASEEDVSRYASRRLAGEQPPAIVAVLHSDGSIMMLDGAHRTAMARRTSTPLDGYIGVPKKKPVAKLPFKTQKAEPDGDLHITSHHGRDCGKDAFFAHALRGSRPVGYAVARKGEKGYSKYKVEVAPNEDPHMAEQLAKELEKAALPMPHAPTHAKMNLPVGTQLDGVGKVKVEHADGSTSWKSVRAGQIRSQDPTGHPTSSREPNAR